MKSFCDLPALMTCLEEIIPTTFFASQAMKVRKYNLVLNSYKKETILINNNFVTHWRMFWKPQKRVHKN